MVRIIFVVEPYDELVLSNPIDQIITPGGFIFMASLNSEIIGTFAFIKKKKVFMSSVKWPLRLNNAEWVLGIKSFVL